MWTFNSSNFSVEKPLRAHVYLFFSIEGDCCDRLLFLYELFYAVLDLAFLKKYIQFFSLPLTSVENVLNAHLEKLEP